MGDKPKVWTLTPQYCPKCGKEFYPTAYWAYKDRLKTWCSWKCFNHRYDGVEKKQSKDGFKRKRVEQLNLDGETVIAVYDSPTDAAWAVDGFPNPIYDACRLGRKYKGYLWRYLDESAQSKEEVKIDNDSGTVEKDIR